MNSASPQTTNVYMRNAGKLACIKVGTDDHEEAILSVKEEITEAGQVWNEPILALIQGGANDN